MGSVNMLGGSWTRLVVGLYSTGPLTFCVCVCLCVWVCVFWC